MLKIKNGIKYFFGIVLSLITFNRCGIMNDNPIYKHNPAVFFESPELEIAQAIRANDPSKIEQLCKDPNVNLNTLGKKGSTLLFWAVAHRFPKTIEKLLKLGADPNIKMDDENEGVHIVAMCAAGEEDESFSLMLEYGGDPNGEMGGTPATFQTVYIRRKDRLELLLQKGANIDAVDKPTNLSLIHFCAQLNLFDYVVFLLEKGADFSRGNGVGGSVAFEVQDMKGKLNEEMENWRARAEYILIDKGVKFPIILDWMREKND